MEKVDIAKLLMGCPAGMELDCTIYEGVTFIRVDIRDYEFYPIKLKTRSGLELTLTKYGQYARHEDAKCVIFPKGKTSWEDFVTCKFKDGDICYVKTEHSESIFIFEGLNEFNFIKRYVTLRNDGLSADDGTVCQITSAKEFRFATEEEKKKLFDAIEANGYKWDDETKTLNKEFKDGDIIIKGRYIAIFWHIKSNGLIYYHCWYDTKYKDVRLEKDFGIGNINDKPMTRLATEEEKKTLFDAIEAKGYKWNEETKTLEKLIKPKFKIGDIIQDVNADGHKVRITKVNIDEKSYDYEYLDIQGWSILLFSEQDKWKLVNDNFESKSNSPKFKFGDIIQDVDERKVRITKVDLEKKCYYFESFIYKGIGIGTGSISFGTEDRWKLVPNKFDIKSLKPFDKVLCRKNDGGFFIWECDLFSYYNDSEPYNKFYCIGRNYMCCIPYDGNEHLIGTNMECDKFYKTWEE